MQTYAALGISGKNVFTISCILPKYLRLKRLPVTTLEKKIVKYRIQA